MCISNNQTAINLAFESFLSDTNYELKADSGSICDSLTVSLTPALSVGEGGLFVFYHHDWQTAFINAKGLKGKKYILSVTDVLGHIVFRENGKIDSPYYTHDLHMQGKADGLYIVSLVTEKEVLSRKFVRQ